MSPAFLVSLGSLAALLAVAGSSAGQPAPAPAAGARAGDQVGGLPRATRSEVMAPRAMAATSHPLATQAALEVMKAGGSAVDAAIAANACLGLMEPTGSGIGGDLFAIVWDPESSRLRGYNGSGRSSAGATFQQMKAAAAARAGHAREHLASVPPERRAEQIPAFGPLPVTVPGCVDGWFALHGRFGRLPMRDVLAPAIRYAQDGFPMAPVIAEAWAASTRRFEGFPNVAEQFTLAGRAPRAGDIWRNPNLAAVYQKLAAEGRGAFYGGEVAKIVGAFIKEQGGFVSADDLASHRGEWVEPVSARYRGCDVWELPPNGQGIAALQILKIMEGYDVRAMGWGSADYVHAMVEAKKLAFEDRARYYADPAFAAAPVARLISDGYAAERRARIDMTAAAKAPEPGVIPAGADTVYLTTADERGMMVSLIQSNYRGMGSGMVPPGLGFMLQNRGEQFALIEGHPNAYAPGKRPFHTIIPAFITRQGKPWLSFGVMGGAMQPQGHAQIVMNLIDFGMTLQQAGDAPRIHHDGSTEPQGAVRPMTDGGVLNLEPGFPEATLRELAARGHTIRPASTPTFGGYQAILRDPATGAYTGASESRKDGHAAGY
ncbi:MAG: gamma-glutamyltransferase [Phycisphaerales bacterium]|nr:gamma-glutamyltransferase [Phycisphaerales bacterium]